MHDLDPPMIAIDAQQRLWRGGGGQAGDEIDDLVLWLLPLGVLLDLAAPRNIFSLTGFVLKILKSVAPSPTRAIEHFQDDRNRAIRLFSGFY